MFDVLLVVLFVWLFFKAVGLALRLAWGTARIIATVLFVLAVPMLILCLVFAGGVLLLIPVAVLAVAFALVKACV